jgi:hypothetical protein
MKLYQLLMVTFLWGIGNANAGEAGYWLYCEATRDDDGAKVKYEFEIADEIAHLESGDWHVFENARILRLTYIHPDGHEDTGAFITISRLTGELYHYAYGISIYRTQPSDRPCERLEQRF